MVNKTGNSMDMPRIDNRVGVSTAAPRVRYSSTSSASANAGQAEFSLAKTLRGMSDRLEDRLDIIAQVEGLEQGAIDGSSGQLPTLKDASTIRGRAYNAAAKDAAAVQYDLKGRQALSEYERNHAADPLAFKSKAEKYIDGVLPELRQFDPAFAERYKAEFALRTDSAINRVHDRQKAIARDMQLETALRHQLAVQDDLAQDAAALFSGSSQDASVTFERMLANASSIVDTANQIGPDGRPLFSAQQRVAAERDAEKIVSQQIGLAWMQSQPDMLSAFDKWQHGEATFELAGDDGQVSVINLKDVLGARGYMQAEEMFFDQLRSELALSNQVDAARDRAFAENSDALYSDFQVMAQDGTLTLDKVEAARPQLEDDRYVALREIAKGGFATVSNNDVLSRLIDRDAQGQDIRGELRAEKSSLTAADYNRLYDRNADRLKKGVTDPVSTGRDYVGNSLGKLSTNLGFAQSIAIPKAEAEYETRVQQFIAKEDRQPSHSEALNIANDVVGRYSVIDLETQLTTMPKPMMLPAAKKISRNLSTADIDDAARKTTEHFLKMNNNDADALRRDQRFIEEMDLLNDYQQLLQARETVNGTGQ